MKKKTLLVILLSFFPTVIFAMSTSNNFFVKVVENGKQIDNKFTALEYKYTSPNYGSYDEYNLGVYDYQVYGGSFDTTFKVYKLTKSIDEYDKEFSQKYPQCKDIYNTDNSYMKGKCMDWSDQEIKAFILQNAAYSTKEFLVKAPKGEAVSKTLTIDIKKNTIKDSNPMNAGIFSTGLTAITYLFYGLIAIFVIGIALLVLFVFDYFKTKDRKYLTYMAIVSILMLIVIIRFLFG